MIRRYTQPQEPVTVALLMGDGRALSEHGQVFELNQLRRGERVRVYASWDTVDELLRDQHRGEALAWNGGPIRWRAERHPEEVEQWRYRPSDVNVLKTPFPEGEQETLQGLVEFRDWLQRYGANPQSSLGGSAMSLIRATLPHDLWTMRGVPPPFTWTLGGRQELAAPIGSSHRAVVHVDLPAAYPREMGGLMVGNGIWRHLSERTLRRFPPEFRARLGPLVCRARVEVPELRFGPLPQRPETPAPPGSWERCAVLDGTAVTTYPTGCVLEGMWVWEELAEAGRAGCAIELLEGWWLDNDASFPLLDWWQAVVEGRAMPGFAGRLAKSCSNAAWGQFVVSDEGSRQIVSFDSSEPSSRKLAPLPGGQRRSHDVAELICGRVRARLAGMMRELAPYVLSVHTDGGWVEDGVPPEGWLVKEEARRLDLIGPQTLRYWKRSSGRPLYCVAGWPQRLAQGAFESMWAAIPR